MATHRIVANKGLIDKIVGDEVMALFIPGPSGPGYREDAITTALEIMHAVGYGKRGDVLLPIGIGVHAGRAWVGKVITAGASDVTALGDMVNTASRLQGAAEPGQIVVSEAMSEQLGPEFANAEQKSLTVKGKDDTVDVRVLNFGAVSD